MNIKPKATLVAGARYYVGEEVIEGDEVVGIWPLCKIVIDPSMAMADRERLLAKHPRAKVFGLTESGQPYCATVSGAASMEAGQ